MKSRKGEKLNPVSCSDWFTDFALTAVLQQRILHLLLFCFAAEKKLMQQTIASM